MLCVSLVLLELLSFTSISLVHHEDFVGEIFYYMYLLMTSVNVHLETILVRWLYCETVITHNIS